MTSDFKTRFSELVDGYEGNATELAKGLQVSKQTISAWKSGERSPKKPTIETIARFFHVSVAWLMGLDCPKDDQVLPAPTMVFLDNAEIYLVDLWRKLDVEDKMQVINFLLKLINEKEAKT